MYDRFCGRICKPVLNVLFLCLLRDYGFGPDVLGSESASVAAKFLPVEDAAALTSDAAIQRSVRVYSPDCYHSSTLAPQGYLRNLRYYLGTHCNLEHATHCGTAPIPVRTLGRNRSLYLLFVCNSTDVCGNQCTYGLQHIPVLHGTLDRPSWLCCSSSKPE